ncbi:MAG: hypothetical protein Q9191_004695 [Dirinaria sp. TL-2023a]
MARKAKPAAASKGVRFSDTVETIGFAVADDLSTSTPPQDTVPPLLRSGSSRNPPAIEAAKGIPHLHLSAPSNKPSASDNLKPVQRGTPGILVINRPIPPSHPSHNQATRIPRKPVPAQANKEADRPLRRVATQLPPRVYLAPPKLQKDDAQQALSTRQRQRSLGLIPDEQLRLAPKLLQAQQASELKELTERGALKRLVSSSPQAQPAKELTQRELELLVKPDDSSSQSGWYQTTSAALLAAATHAMMDDGKDKSHPDVLLYDFAGGLQSFKLISTEFGDPQPEHIHSRIKKWLNEVEEVSEQKQEAK